MIWQKQTHWRHGRKVTDFPFLQLVLLFFFFFIDSWLRPYYDLFMQECSVNFQIFPMGTRGFPVDSTQQARRRINTQRGVFREGQILAGQISHLLEQMVAYFIRRCFFFCSKKYYSVFFPILKSFSVYIYQGSSRSLSLYIYKTTT